MAHFARILVLREDESQMEALLRRHRTLAETREQRGQKELYDEDFGSASRDFEKASRHWHAIAMLSPQTDSKGDYFNNWINDSNIAARIRACLRCQSR